MKASELNGMAVVSLQEGAKIGHVDQPMFDLSARQLRALHVKGDSGISVLPFSAIENIGSDAITVITSQVTQTPGFDSANQGSLDLQSLRKLKIVDQDGTFLGTLSEIEFDPTNGQVTQLTAHKGGVLGMGGTTTVIDTTAALTVGAELLTVNAEIADPPGADSTTIDSTRTDSTAIDPAPTHSTSTTSTAPTTSTTSTAATIPSNRPPLSPSDPSSPEAEAEVPTARS